MENENWTPLTTLDRNEYQKVLIRMKRNRMKRKVIDGKVCFDKNEYDNYVAGIPGRKPTPEMQVKNINRKTQTIIANWWFNDVGIVKTKDQNTGKINFYIGKCNSNPLNDEWTDVCMIVDLGIKVSEEFMKSLIK